MTYSNLDKAHLLNRILHKNNFYSYLEIGVRNGENFFKIRSKKKVGVDPNYFFSKKFYLKSLCKPYNWNYKMYRKTSDAFFQSEAEVIYNHDKMDVAFIDGMHTYEQSLNDARNCLKYLEPDGIIIFHDCNPQSEQAASPEIPSTAMNWNGDVWKTIYHIRGLRDYFECLTLDDDQGLGLLTVKQEVDQKILNMLEPDEEISKLPYKFLNDNRTNIIGLTNQKDYKI